LAGRLASEKAQVLLEYCEQGDTWDLNRQRQTLKEIIVIVSLCCRWKGCCRAVWNDSRTMIMLDLVGMKNFMRRRSLLNIETSNEDENALKIFLEMFEVQLRVA
jgi:hypothetical protein